MKESKWRKHRRCHARIRAAERYRLHLTRQDLRNIAGMIRNGKAAAGHRLSQSKSVALVNYQGRALIVLYSSRHDEVITFLPPDCADAKRLEAMACG